MFAELLVQAQGHGDAEEIAKTMTLVDIIYQMKKVEEETKKPEPEPEKKAEPSSTEEPEKTPEPEKKAEPEPEPEIVVKIKDFWSRLTHDSDSD
jgi:hypothetical protein